MAKKIRGKGNRERAEKKIKGDDKPNEDESGKTTPGAGNSSNITDTLGDKGLGSDVSAPGTDKGTTVSDDGISQDNMQKKETVTEKKKTSIDNTSIESLEGRLTELKRLEEELRKSLEGLKRSKDEFIDKCRADAISEMGGNYEKALDFLKKANENWKESQDAKYQALSDGFTTCHDQFVKMEKMILSYKKEISEYKEKIDEKDSEIKDLNRKLKRVKQESECYRGEALNSQTLEGSNRALNAVIENLRGEVRSYMKLLRETEEQLTAKEQFLIQNDIDPNLEIKLRTKEDEISDLKKKNEELNQKLTENEETIYDMGREIAEKKAIITKLESNNLSLDLELRAIKTDEKFKESFRLRIKELNDAAEELNRAYKTSEAEIFPNLSDIDEKYNDVEVNSTEITLEELCYDFLYYMAHNKEKRLYYTMQTVRTFIAGMASSKIIILEGLSGTGKSSLPDAFKSFATTRGEMIPVQSAWSNRYDLLGSYNDFKRQYKETEFLKLAYTALRDSNNMYCIVLDEMNIARIEYYFADILSVLENSNRDKWLVNLIPDTKGIAANDKQWPEKIKNGNLKIGSNIWFIGTANNDDSTNTITDKVYDRSTVIRFDKKGTYEDTAESVGWAPNREKRKPKYQRITLGYSRFMEMCDGVTLSNDDDRKFRLIIKDLDYMVKKYFSVAYGNRIQNQLERFIPVYVKCGGSVEEAIDAMYSCKVIRKIENAYVENMGDKLAEFEKYVKQKYPMMKLTIERISEIRGSYV